MRRFYLINAKGQEFDLNRKDAMLITPEGLGVKSKNTYAQVGTSFLTTKQALEQKKPSGKIYFRGYEVYSEFSALSKFSPLTLKYIPYEGEELYLDVESVDLTKGEIDHNSNYLICGVQFVGVSSWYREKRAIRNIPENTGKRYPYTYDYTYLDNASGVIELTNRSSLDAIVKIIIIGPATNPYWELRHNGDLLLTGRVNIKLEAEHRLVINADPRAYEIGEYDGKDNRIEDRYGDSDFSTERFLYAPPGESRISFTHNDVTPLTIYAEVCEIVE